MAEKWESFSEVSVEIPSTESAAMISQACNLIYLSKED